MRLSLVIPCHPSDHDALRRLLASIDAQDFPKVELEVLLQYQGNSEEAKAYGIQRAQGEIIGLLCTDNVLVGRTFLADMVEAASQAGVVGAYTRQYAYVRTDTILNRYFALLGANDPLCWWLGKADRVSYLHTESPGQNPHYTFTDRIPSIGDNGFFVKAALFKRFVTDSRRHFCIDACEDLRRAGDATYAVTSNTIWHRTGESWTTYFRKRWRYVTELYWRDYAKRRWHMVDGWRDWSSVLLFVLSSLVFLPHLFISIRGYRRIRDPAWFLHPVLCSSLTCLYLFAWLYHHCPSLFPRGIDQRPWLRAWRV